MNISSEKKIPSDSSVSEAERVEKIGRQGDQILSEKKHKKPVDPTRYGDWEKNGRCIDF